MAGRDKVLAYFADWQARQGGSDAESKCLIVKLAAEQGFSAVPLEVGEEPRYRDRGALLRTG